MQRALKIVVAAFIALIIVAVPLYYYTRPDFSVQGTLRIEGAVANPLTLTTSQLEGYSATTLQVTLSSSSRISDNGIFNYTGVLLGELLTQAQVFGNATSVYVAASDGYGTTIPLADAMKADTIITYQKDGAPLTLLKDDGEGPLRLIIGSDQYAQRWIRGVADIAVS